MPEPVRLSKRLIELTQCSRREAELYIEGGWVTVNGEVIEFPQHEVTDETVALHPQANVTAAGPICMVVHKPAGQTIAELLPQLSAQNHWAEDPADTRILKRHFRHLTDCFELPNNFGGLCVLTQNRHLLNRWQERHSTMEHEYVVDFAGDLTDAELNHLNQSHTYQGKREPAAKVSRQKETRLRFALKNPQPGQIMRLCESVNLTVLAVTRLRLGAVLLRKLPPGQWRYLPDQERF